jgi:hypothetical protein
LKPTERQIADLAASGAVIRAVGVDHVDGAEIGVGAGGVGDPLHVSKRQHRSVRDGSVGPLATSVTSSWNVVFSSSSACAPPASDTEAAAATPATTTPSARVIFIVRPHLIATGDAAAANVRISALNITRASGTSD